MKKVLISLLTGAFVFIATGVVFAAEYTYTPTDNDLDDLNHDYAYTWRINLASQGLDILTENIDGATLYFNDIHESSVDLNDILHVNLIAGDAVPNPDGDLDNVDRFYDDHNPTYDNYFNSHYSADETTLLFAFTGMDNDERDITLSLINEAYSGEIMDIASWLDESHDQTDGARLEMPANGLSHLISYAQGGIFGLGFDPDCHFYNHGITLTLLTSDKPTSSPDVPEPATLMLFGTGLLCFASRMRKNNQA